MKNNSAKVCHCTLHIFNSDACKDCFKHDESFLFNAKDFNITTNTTATESLKKWLIF
jgi:glutaredoxin-related protein